MVALDVGDWVYFYKSMTAQSNGGPQKEWTIVKMMTDACTEFGGAFLAIKGVSTTHYECERP